MTVEDVGMTSDAIRASSAAWDSFHMIGCRVEPVPLLPDDDVARQQAAQMEALESGFSFGDPAVMERLRGWQMAVPYPFDLVDVRRLESRLRWRGSWLPWRRRAALMACRELIRLRERQLGLDR